VFCFLKLRATAREIGPTLPKYIVAVIINLPTALRLEVRFLERPTVAVALTVSYAISIAEAPSVTAARSKVEQNIIKKDGITIIDDTYNAGPESMKASLSVLCAMQNSGRKIAVLGDMLELGENAVAQHAEILKFALEKFPTSKILAVGSLMKEAGGTWGEKNIVFLEKSTDAAQILPNFVDENTLVFLKGSRGIKLENAIPLEAR
jgi:UDP-N-acetylmuramoyl-tripeptide--D-alanyl-D-alanine ligase